MVLGKSEAFSGIAVRDMDAAKAFYGEVLGLDVQPTEMGMLSLAFPSGRRVLVYPSPSATPASFTVLNFPVPDVDATVDELTARGVVFERYAGMPQGENGVMHDHGPTIAWFTDPTGNVLSIIEE